MAENTKKPAIRFAGFTEAWEQRKVNEICYISTGRSNTQDKIDDGKYPFYVRSPIIERSNRYLYDEEAVLTVGDGVGTGKVFHYVNGKYDIHQRVYRLFGFSDDVDAKFFYHWFSENFYNRVMSMTAKTSVDSVRLEMIADMEMTAPPYDEQKKISSYLDHLDHLITLHQRKYDKLTNAKKSMLEKMFPKNGSNVPEIRFKGFTEAWEQRKLSEIATMHARIGWQNLRTSEFLDSGDYMLITGTDFMDGAVIFNNCHYVERERYEQDKHIQIRNGSILITKDGTLGKVAYIQGLTIPATLNAGVFNVEIKNEKEVDNRYLFQYLKAPFLMDYVDKKATGGTIKHLNQNILVDFPVVLPKKVEQEKIGEYFLAIDNLITLHQRKLEKLKNIKKSMLEKMFI